MKTVLLLVQMIHSVFSDKNSLRVFSAKFSGIPNFPDFSATAEMNGIKFFYTNRDETLKKNQDQIKAQMQADADLVDLIKKLDDYLKIQSALFKEMINDLKQSFNQTEGVDVFQMISESEWSDEKRKTGLKSAYDGEDFMSLSSENRILTAHRSESITVNKRFKSHFRYLRNVFTRVSWNIQQKHVDFTKHIQSMTVLPSVSLLQKSPSSPITCHATGFYPNSAVLFWRKDGEELFEDVEHGEILPNQDGSFQMSVELLKLPSEDWGKYECVFQFSGVKEEIITKLHKNKIRTNYKAPHDVTIITIIINIIIITITAVAVVCLVAAAHKKRKAKCPESTGKSSSDSSDSSDSCQKLMNEPTLDERP